MYSVSQDYLDKLSAVGRKKRAVQGTIGGIAFDEDDIVANSLKYTFQAVGNADIKLGGVFLGQVTLTFTKNFARNVTRGNWNGLPLVLSIGLRLDNDSYEYVPIGKFAVAEANHTLAGVELTFYDNMLKFDKSLNVSTTAGSMYSLVKFCCDRCGVEMGMTREEIEAMPNGDEVFSLYPDNDMSTYRDFISWIAVTMCSFATMNREGKLVFRTWSDTPVYTFGIDDRFSGASFSDFVTRYTGLTVGNIAEQKTEYIHVEPDNGLTMNIGMNPLLQYGLAETRLRQRMNILSALGNFEYTPFRAVSFIDPFIDLGDVIVFEDGMAGTSSTCCVMRIDFTYGKGVTLQGFGKNPALFGAQSKTDKDISGLMSQSEENQIAFLTFTNADEIVLNYSENDGLQDTALATFQLTPIRDTNLDINTRVIYSDLMTAEANEQFVKTIKAIRYELDGDVLARVPYEDTPYSIVDNRLLGQERNNTIEDYQILLNLKAGERKNLVVYLEYDVNGTATNQQAKLTLPSGGVNITVRGQGLLTEEAWDGLIQLVDNVPYVAISGLGIDNIDDAVSVSLQIVQHIQLSDDLDELNVEGLEIVEIVEDLDITMVRPTFNTVDETGEYNLVTEDGLYNLVTE